MFCVQSNKNTPAAYPQYGYAAGVIKLILHLFEYEVS